ncbi:hypothetical protein QMK17_17675 [Rhodococcus sp. G-MC3]|uniref:hypothetical protein n=1 Tax=Rhodococcus sp. G-MC3 TaxID=3046209 RepID=UPI0024B98758|nr:hypothetical protein [Rhodococcus sp. G-MC3]MDJ0395158.1 hypothetical protein [Rhodococcus sp. G-MC3]
MTDSVHARVRGAARGRTQARLVTYAALVYARIWRADITFEPSCRLFVASNMRGGFGRGGTTIGGVYLTRTNTSQVVLRHEAVHADQWARYGVTFAVRYLAEEIRRPGPRNRYEIEAGLRDGGYTT